LDLAEVKGSYYVAWRSSKLNTDRALIKFIWGSCIIREIAYRDLVRKVSKSW
jgi:hypothetical protein